MFFADVYSIVNILHPYELRSWSLLTFIRMENDLSDMLGVKVDLVMKNALKSALEQSILSERVQI
jgi:predicted nucleotidyltransferase